MATWWHEYKWRLCPVEVERSTAKRVWINSFVQRHIGSDWWGSYYPTREAAHAAILAEAEQELESARTKLNRALDRLTIVANMNKPEGV